MTADNNDNEMASFGVSEPLWLTRDSGKKIVHFNAQFHLVHTTQWNYEIVALSKAHFLFSDNSATEMQKKME